ncbi:MAG TPA: peptidoglycan-binding protein [Chthoniobacteraceae bacterium]
MSSFPDMTLSGGAPALRLFLPMILSLLCCGPLRAEDALLPVQRELRARKFYFGDLDGRASEETVAAIRKFQEARGIDRTGNLDQETLRALGLRASQLPAEPGAQALAECCDLVRRFFLARQAGDLEQTTSFYADEVSYYFEQELKRPALRERHAEENRRWPRRKYTLLNRIASLAPGREDTAQVTARVLSQVGSEAGAPRSATEDLVIRLRKTSDGWRIVALKLLE